MTTTTVSPADDQLDAARLLAEVERYLRVVDAYRSEGCEPRWLAEADAPRP